MPTLYVSPKIFFYHRGVLVRHTYKHDDYPVNEHLSFSYLINGYEFDVRDIASKAGAPPISNDPLTHQQAIIVALEQHDSTLAKDAQVTLDDRPPLTPKEQGELVSLYNAYEQLHALATEHAYLEAPCAATKKALQQRLADYRQHPIMDN
jgi:hypothetical protein